MLLLSALSRGPPGLSVSRVGVPASWTEAPEGESKQGGGAVAGEIQWGPLGVGLLVLNPKLPVWI